MEKEKQREDRIERLNRFVDRMLDASILIALGVMVYWCVWWSFVVIG